MGAAVKVRLYTAMRGRSLKVVEADLQVGLLRGRY
jgi:hypothetical protein